MEALTANNRWLPDRVSSIFAQVCEEMVDDRRGRAVPPRGAGRDDQVSVKQQVSVTSSRNWLLHLSLPTSDQVQYGRCRAPSAEL